MNLLEEMKGQTFTNVCNIDNKALIFNTENGIKYIFDHFQVCCENVYIEDICGDLKDLIGYPLTVCEMSTNIDTWSSDSQTWTFYKFATIKGYVDIRWYGSSNGNYSEKVNLRKELGGAR